MAQRLIWKISSFPIVKITQPSPPSPPSPVQYFTAKKKMPLKTTTAAVSFDNSTTTTLRKLPILLFDVMDTIVRDPFYHDVPAFFGMSMKELLECKHPTAWIEFEKGLIDEMELARIFFKDGRPVNLEGLKSCMRRGYSYIEGVEGLLDDLKKKGFEMHTFTNYPIWYEMIEEKLKLSAYLSWTFCSCIMGKRKPDPDFYTDVAKHLKVEPTSCIFIDDRMRNVEGALDAGFIGIQFKNVELLRKDLDHLFIDDIQTNKWTNNQDFAESSH